MNVVIAIVMNADRVALIRRTSPEGDLEWQFPAGKVESKESERDALVREVQEELGVHCRPRRKLGKRRHPTKPLDLHYWVCDYIEGELSANSPNEVSEACWASSEEALQLITSSIFPPVRDLLGAESSNDSREAG